MSSKKAILQLNELEKYGKNIRLAADGWKKDWQTLIAILMSARTKDKKTIHIAKKLFKKYPSLLSLSEAKREEIESIIKPINFYKRKSKNIENLSKILLEKYKSKTPNNFDDLIELPGIGRKTANVFLAEKGEKTIGVDTHVTYISRYLGWTNKEKQEEIEKDLKNLFPKRFWGKLNWILVRFGQTYTNKRLKNEILEKLKNQ